MRVNEKVFAKGGSTDQHPDLHVVTVDEADLDLLLDPGEFDACRHEVSQKSFTVAAFDMALALHLGPDLDMLVGVSPVHHNVELNLAVGHFDEVFDMDRACPCASIHLCSKFVDAPIWQSDHFPPTDHNCHLAELYMDQDLQG